MAKNSESQGVGNLLADDRDRYALSPCSAGLWFVIGLSEDVLIDTLALANYEKYSSGIREFELWGSLRYPIPENSEEWSLLGRFEAQDKYGE
jgi:hypothetical protein